MITNTDPNFKKLSKTEKLFVQEVVGTFLYYAGAIVCPIMLPDIGSIATRLTSQPMSVLRNNITKPIP